MNIDLAGEVALVTGASRGIGRAIAAALGRAGATVAVHFRTGAREAAALVRELPAAASFDADLADEGQVRLLHERVERAFGPVTILVNNAGTWEDNPAGGPETQERYRRLMAVNVDAPHLLCNLVVPGMKDRGGGSILNISSRAGSRGEPHAAHYALSKGAINALTVSLARELAPCGVRVNAVAPGWIETPLTERHLADPETRAAVEKETLLGRVGTPEEVADAALFLVSPLAGYVTGQILHVNGGSYLHT